MPLGYVRPSPLCASPRGNGARPPSLRLEAFGRPCPARQLRAPSACLSQPRGVGNNWESGIKPCALAPPPSRPQVSSKRHREWAAKGGWGGVSRVENRRINPQLSPEADPNPRVKKISQCIKIFWKGRQPAVTATTQPLTPCTGRGPGSEQPQACTPPSCSPSPAPVS